MGDLGTPGRAPAWLGVPVERARLEWRPGDGSPVAALEAFLGSVGLPLELTGDRRPSAPAVAVALLVGAQGCAALTGFRAGRPSPVPAVPELVAVAYTTGGGAPPDPPSARAGGGAPAPAAWRTSWAPAEHAAAVEAVRQEIAAGALYQANVVGHRQAAHHRRPLDLARAVATLPGATYAGVVAGEGWAVGCASPELLVRVEDGGVTTEPVKGTLPAGPGAEAALRASPKDRAEHVMIVDLARNDLSRVARTGSVAVQTLYRTSRWAGLWHASSTVSATLEAGTGVADVLGALLPGGSVTGAPKRAACAFIDRVEPVGRGPSMGAMGWLWAGGLELGLTIRTVAVDDRQVHLWAGGGVTWGSDPQGEVDEAEAKAIPVMALVGGFLDST